MVRAKTGLLGEIERIEDKLPEAERKVAHTILECGCSTAKFTITRLAHEAGTSTSAVQRLCRSLGYTGYKELRYTLAAEIQTKQDDTLMDGDGPMPAAIEAVAKAMGSLTQLNRDKLDHLAGAIAGARLVICTGIHYSGLPAKMLRMCLEDLGVPTISACDVVAAAHLSALMTDDACLVHFSVAGSQPPLIHADGSCVPGEFWLVTMGTRPADPISEDHVIRLPYPGTAGNQAVMVALAEVVALLVGERLMAS